MTCMNAYNDLLGRVVVQWPDPRCHPKLCLESQRRQRPTAGSLHSTTRALLPLLVPLLLPLLGLLILPSRGHYAQSSGKANWVSHSMSLRFDAYYCYYDYYYHVFAITFHYVLLPKLMPLLRNGLILDRVSVTDAKNLNIVASSAPAKMLCCCCCCCAAAVAVVTAAVANAIGVAIALVLVLLCSCLFQQCCCCCCYCCYDFCCYYY